MFAVFTFGSDANIVHCIFLLVLMLALYLLLLLLLSLLFLLLLSSYLLEYVHVCACVYASNLHMYKFILALMYILQSRIKKKEKQHTRATYSNWITQVNRQFRKLTDQKMELHWI